MARIFGFGNFGADDDGAAAGRGGMGGGLAARLSNTPSG
jgi:hypothetical protein